MVPMLTDEIETNRRDHEHGVECKSTTKGSCIEWLGLCSREAQSHHDSL